MEAFFEDLLNKFLDFISQYSFFIEPSYYENLFSKYFSVVGFIIGFILVLLIYFSGIEDERISNFFRALPIIAVINSCTVIATFFDGMFDQGLNYTGIDAMLNAPDNIFSGFIITLVVISCYKEYGVQAFIFGIAANAALPLLNYSYFEDIEITVPLLHMILRIALIGIICAIISHRKYFFTGWIWYFIFHIFIRLAVYFMPMLINAYNEKAIINIKEIDLTAVVEYLSQFTVDAFIFAIILFISILYEKVVLTVKLPKKAI